ncbi:DUF2452 domain-containing protein [Bernardetia sp.]|uniref:DUF2452 domain-containing protein n=1 Tax=Bernardetia sp. TaxID=1937974 RepID=UPI0025C4AAC8|nr:DUF2452 domain-containing protein [Bernardetia sp.]
MSDKENLEEHKEKQKKQSIFDKHQKEKFENIINPIDADKTAKNPGLLPYAHTVGGAIIIPTEKGIMKSKALAAMEQQTEMQLNQIKEQIDLLAKQAKEIQSRTQISMEIYNADMGFEPLVNHNYFLYERTKTGEKVLSMIAPDQWGRSSKLHFMAEVQLLADRTWKVIRENSEDSIDI